MLHRRGIFLFIYFLLGRVECNSKEHRKVSVGRSRWECFMKALWFYAVEMCAQNASWE